MKIAVANIKGGVGKSTIANLIAQKLQLPLKEMDKFQDGSTLNYADKWSSGQENYIADLGGYMGNDMQEEIKKADIVVVPMLPGPRDFLATVTFLEWLFGFYDGKVLIIANQSDEKEAKEVKKALEEAFKRFERIGVEDIRFTRLPRLKSLKRWELDKKSWIDFLQGWNFSYKKAAKHIEEFCIAMEDWIKEK